MTWSPTAPEPPPTVHPARRSPRLRWRACSTSWRARSASTRSTCVCATPPRRAPRPPMDPPSAPSGTWRPWMRPRRMPITRRRSVPTRGGALRAAFGSTTAERRACLSTCTSTARWRCRSALRTLAAPALRCARWQRRRWGSNTNASRPSSRTPLLLVTTSAPVAAGWRSHVALQRSPPPSRRSRSCAVARRRCGGSPRMRSPGRTAVRCPPARTPASSSRSRSRSSRATRPAWAAPSLATSR